MAPLLRGDSREGHKAIYWEHEGNRAVRQGKWKLVSKRSAPENGRWELYDMEADRTEMHDLAKENPNRVAHMSKLWFAWAGKTGLRARR